MSGLFEKFSSKENLKRAYSYVQNELAHSSLSVNPINHPATTAINNLGENFFIALEQHLRSGDYKPEKGFFVYIPKDNLGLRPVCVLSMVDRIVFQAIFNQDILGHKIDGQLSDKLCFANRVSDAENGEYFLDHYFNAWDRFLKEQIKAFGKGYKWKLEVDVQQYYEHVPAVKLIEKLKNDFGIKNEKILAILEEQLRAWVEYPELPKGIPQGPEASAVLGNVYLAPLDLYAEKELVGKSLRYFRYADDITLMGKSKEDILNATEKIVRFLREHNLTLNEKTKLAELENVDSIEAMRFLSDYADDATEIPDDDFVRVQNNAPRIVASIHAGEKVERSDISQLKYFLKIGTVYTLPWILQLIDIIPLRPSLAVPIIKYVSEGRKTTRLFGNRKDVARIDIALWETYRRTDISEWSRFWIFKLLVANKDVYVSGVGEEVERILSSKDNTVFKIVCFYYQAIQEKKIDVEQVKQALDGSKTDVEKSLYSFFLLNAYFDARVPTIKNGVEKLLDSSSHELNLIGAYLLKNKPEVSVDDVDGEFSRHLLKKTKNVHTTKATSSPQGGIFLVRSENLIPVSSPSTIFGVNRTQSKKRTVELDFPEAVHWEKVLLKIKEGLQDIEIWYDGKHIKTASYVELGFSSNKKEHKPNRSWNFLTILSVLQNEDMRQATPDKLMPMLAKHSGHATKRANVHQTKKLLSKELRAIFKTGDNPFVENRKYYEPRFKILPEAMMRTKELWKQGGQLNENIDYGNDEE